MEWRSRKDGVAGRWRGSWSRAFVFAVAQDFSDGGGLGDESEDLHLGSAVRTGQRVDIIDAVDELGPALG